MHACTEQLLSLRDGEPIDAQVAHHVEGCATCLLELDRLRQVQSRLQSLLPRTAPPTWERVHARMHEPRPGLRHGRFTSAAAAAVFGVFAILFGIRLLNGEQPAVQGATDMHSPLPPIAASSPAPATWAVSDLVAQSRELDNALRTLPDRPRVERVALAATMDTIELRIQWLDFQLSFAPDADLSQEQAQRLWRERVDLMDSLVKVRYAQVQGLSF